MYKRQPLIPEPTKVADKDDLTSIEISSQPGTAGAARVKVAVKILEGLDDGPLELIAWRKSVEHAFVGLNCATGSQQMAPLPQFARGFARTTLEVTSEKAIQGTLPLTPVLALNANTHCPNIFRKGH